VTAWNAGQEGTAVRTNHTRWCINTIRSPDDEYCDSSLLTGILSSHLHRLSIPDDVLIQFELLMMSTVMLETCREMKEINTWKSASSWLLARIRNEMHGQQNIKVIYSVTSC